MSSPTVFLAATAAVAAPVTTPTDTPPVASAGTQTDGQTSFAQIMSDATGDGATNRPSSSSPTKVGEDKDDKGGKRKDDKAQAQQVTAQIVATLVPPQMPPPPPVTATGKLADSGAAASALPGSAVETSPLGPLAVGDALGQVIAPADRVMGSDSRALPGTKQVTAQCSTDDLKSSTLAAGGPTDPTYSKEADNQPLVPLPLSSANTNPVPVENAIQRTVATNAGTAIAKQVGRVKMQEKTENNSEVAEKNLPPTSFVAQSETISDAAKVRTTSTNLPQREGHSSNTSDASAPIVMGLGQGKTQPLGGTIGADAVRSPQTDKVFTEISERVMSFKRVGTDSAEVNLRPDSSTEITLSLSLRNGQVEMTARLDRGNLSALNSHWTGLQQSLSQQGVRVGQLTSSQSAMNDQLSSGTPQRGFEENASRSFEHSPENLGEMSVTNSAAGPLKGRAEKAVATAGHGWEMWA